MSYGRKQRIQMAKSGLAIPMTNDAGEILDGSCPIATSSGPRRPRRCPDRLAGRGRRDRRERWDRRRPDGLISMSWYRLRYIAILCGPKW